MGARQDRAYVVVTAWPEGWPQARRVEAIVAASGVDPADAARTAKKPTPALIFLGPVAVGKSVLEELKKLGVSAIGVTDASLALVPKVIAVKRLVPAIGAPEPMFLVEPWEPSRGSFGVRGAEIRLIVRARISVSTQKLGITAEDDWSGTRRAGGGTSSFPGQVGGWLSSPVRDPNGPWLDGPTAAGKAHVESAGVLDLCAHNSAWAAEDTGIDPRIAGWRRLRIDSGKFDFRSSLQEAMGMADAENMERLLGLIVEGAKGAQVDTGFDGFMRGLNAVISLGGPEEGRHGHSAAMRDQLARLSFYSAWALLRMVEMQRRTK